MRRGGTGLEKPPLLPRRTSRFPCLLQHFQSEAPAGPDGLTLGERTYKPYRATYPTGSSNTTGIWRSVFFA
jgi:hypothetical protein